MKREKVNKKFISDFLNLNVALIEILTAKHAAGKTFGV